MTAPARLKRKLLVALAAVLVVAVLVPSTAEHLTVAPTAASAAAPPFQPASWAECNGTAMNVLERPYRVKGGAFWLVDVRRGRDDYTLLCPRPRGFLQRHFYRGVFR